MISRETRAHHYDRLGQRHSRQATIFRLRRQQGGGHALTRELAVELRSTHITVTRLRPVFRDRE